jgi:hypothetical protein
MGFLRRGPEPEHNPSVIYGFSKHDNRGAYGAACRCGWSSEPVEVPYPDPEVEEQVAAAARAHSPNADVTVAFPMDRPR